MSVSLGSDCTLIIEIIYSSLGQIEDMS